MALPKIDLSNASIPELRELASKIESELANRVDAEKASLRAEFESRAKASGFTLSELVGQVHTKPLKKAEKAKGTSVAPKYRNPSNPVETWTGRGRSPAWVKAHTEGGGTLESLLIEPVKA